MDQGWHAKPKVGKEGKGGMGAQTETERLAMQYRAQGSGQLEIQTFSLNWQAGYHFSGLKETKALSGMMVGLRTGAACCS